MKMPFQLLVLCAIPLAAWSEPSARVQPLSGEEQVIYKHVDATGRVTYSNSPIKGGARVVLDTLTVIPSSPSGSLRMPEEQTELPLPAKSVARAGKANAKTTQGALQTQQVATVTTLPPAKAAATPALPVATVTPATTTPTPMEVLAQKRREEVRRRVLQSEIDAEEQMLSEARTQLAMEQKQTGNIRAMRASLASSETNKTVPNAETKALVERHFERVRDLQDQISRHERSLDELRQQLQQAESLRVAKGA